MSCEDTTCNVLRRCVAASLRAVSRANANANADADAEPVVDVQ